MNEMKKTMKAIVAIVLMTAVVITTGCKKDKPTNDESIVVTTSTPRDVTSTTAVCGAAVTEGLELRLSEIGVCWSTQANPTIDDKYLSTTICGEPFVCTITDLEPETKYYVRAYALRQSNYYYGEEKTFTTTEDDGDMEGVLSGLFSVSPSLQVHFSQGNLQYQASTVTWRFAEHQWDYVGTSVPDNHDHIGGTIEGSSNHLLSETYEGWIDMFAWGTSGYDHGALSYQPYNITTMYWDYYAYGSDTCNLYDQTGKADWGYNAIINGGNRENSGWRTLTEPEWHYLLFERATASESRFAKAAIEGVNGLVLLPDNWNAINYGFADLNNTEALFSANLITASEWEAMEEAGAVFMPAAGFRYGANPQFINEAGHYWSSTKATRTDAFYVSFSNLDVSSGNKYYRYPGRAVRLVRSEN